MNKEVIAKFYLTYRLYIFPATVAFSCLILIIFVIYPQMIKLIGDQKVESDFKFRANFLESKIQALESYDETDLSRKINYALNVYPAERDFGNALGLLQGIVSQTGFNIVSLNFGESSTKQVNSQSYALKMEASGARSLLSVLLSNIESANRLMKVSNVEISGSGDQQSVNVVLGIDILYASIPGSFGSVDSPLPEISQKDEELITRLSAFFPVTVDVSQTPTIIGPRGKSNPFE